MSTSSSSDLPSEAVFLPGMAVGREPAVGTAVMMLACGVAVVGAMRDVWGRWGGGDVRRSREVRVVDGRGVLSRGRHAVARDKGCLSDGACCGKV